MEKELLVLTSWWDDLTSDPEDYLLEWDSSELLSILKSLPKLDIANRLIIYSQMIDPKTNASCTKFAGMIGLSNNISIALTWKQVMDCENFSITRFNYKPWTGRPWALWIKSVTTWWNELNNSNKVKYYQLDIFSEQFDVIMERWYLLTISIKVDAEFMRDVRSDNDIDWEKFKQTYWHRTNIMWIFDPISKKLFIRFVDSAFGSPEYYYDCDMSKFKKLVMNWNVMMSNAHIIIPENIIDLRKFEKNYLALKDNGFIKETYFDPISFDLSINRMFAAWLAERIMKISNTTIIVAAQNAKLIWLYDWTRTSEWITREEIAIICSRVLWLKDHSQMINMWIWNWQNGSRIATRYEAMLMLGRTYLKYKSL